ncbi:CLUMA_CG000501, isoform A [Clunio marinus]|uniref:CLUMA_CG000501, isoform A n=1 Tax=Clunio marinus TaxID=568069 RepID=A0A1J1HK93_9DIPT|nr:CLUMA_CG000501, isoform A [Clunio marinus]
MLEVFEIFYCPPKSSNSKSPQQVSSGSHLDEYLKYRQEKTPAKAMIMLNDESAENFCPFFLHFKVLTAII